jgi:LmbE family N-acetylglucosaminyl deacetylase
VFFASLIILTIVAGCGCAVVLLRVRHAAELHVVGDLLIVASHQDDCLILGGELALASLQRGHAVTIAYLTCGDAVPGTSKAEERTAEAKHVWAEAGVSAGDLHFFGLPQTELGQPSEWTSTDHRRAEESLQRLLLAAKPETTVVIPAAYEAHIDHRTTRVAALAAFTAAGRNDLHLMERAEYNELYHAIENPRKLLHYICDQLPLVPRFSRRMIPRSHAGFSTVAPLLALRPDSARELRKQQLMKGFGSEYNGKLAALAAKPEVFRPVRDLGSAANESDRHRPPGWLRVAGKSLHWSAALLVAGVWLVLLSLTGATTEVLLHWSGPAGPYLAGAMLLVIVTEIIRRRNAGGRVMFITAPLIGLVCGASV